MSTTELARWYCVAADGVACVCVDQEDAEQTAKTADMDWPRNGPHQAVLLMDAKDLSMLWGALGACRDAIPVPPIGDANEHLWQQAMQDPKAVPDFVRASVTHITAQHYQLVAELEQESRLMRARMERLQAERDGIVLAIIERLERACGATGMPPTLICREFMPEVAR